MSAVKLMLMVLASLTLVACDHMNIAKLNERVIPGQIIKASWQINIKTSLITKLMKWLTIMMPATLQERR